ncbi:MAG: GldG family protein, partial [Patescibacteria group bacterium]
MKFFTQKLKSSTDFYSQIALILAIVLLANLIFALAPWRFDITEARVYSVSQVTKKTLKDLDDIVTIKAYFTKDLPGYLITVRQQVKDILAEYKNYGAGKIIIKFLNPNASPELEQEAKGLGLPPLQFNIVKKDKFEVAQGYLGIAVLYGEKIETIPVVQNISDLEYNLTAAIKKVITGKEFTIGILQKENILMDSRQLDILRQVLSQQYQVEILDLASQELISDNINTLIIPGPKGDFSQRELYIIDQYIMSGRGVLAAVDGVNVEEGLIASPNESNIFDLLKSYGATVNKDLIFDPISRAQASFSQGFMTFFLPYGFWPKVLNEGFNQESVLVNKLESLFLPWVSSIDLAKTDGNQVLAQTSPKSQLVKENFDLNPQGLPSAIGDGNYATVASINSKLKSFFDAAVGGGESLAETSSKNRLAEVDRARLIVISDADLISGDFIQRYEDNLIFLQNIVDGLTLDESLAAIRSKTVTERPISELDDTARSLVKYGNIVGVPALVVIFAAVRFVWRRKSQRM